MNPFTFIQPHLLLRGNISGTYFLSPSAYGKKWHGPIGDPLNPGTDITDEIPGTCQNFRKEAKTMGITASTLLAAF
jgi:hypothetical protein